MEPGGYVPGIDGGGPCGAPPYGIEGGGCMEPGGYVPGIDGCDARGAGWPIAAGPPKPACVAGA